MTCPRISVEWVFEERILWNGVRNDLSAETCRDGQRLYIYVFWFVPTHPLFISLSDGNQSTTNTKIRSFRNTFQSEKVVDISKSKKKKRNPEIPRTEDGSRTASSCSLGYFRKKVQVWMKSLEEYKNIFQLHKIHKYDIDNRLDVQRCIHFVLAVRYTIDTVMRYKLHI